MTGMTPRDRNLANSHVRNQQAAVMTAGERLFPLRIRTLPAAESFGGVRASVAAARGTLADVLASVAEARARCEGPRPIRERDLPVLRGFE
jgi:hypothetical protein